MSEPKTTTWLQLYPGAHYRVISGNAELLVQGQDDLFVISLSDNKGKEIWTGTYPTRVGAQLAGVAAAKRLLPAECAVVPPKDEPAVAPDDLEAQQEAPQSIWRPTGLRAVVESRGHVATCVINFLDDGFEGVTQLGSYVSRQEYSDEWSAKRGVLQWASLLIERHA